MRQLKISKKVTNRETVSLDKYLSEIGKEDMISGEEEVYLAKKIREGDQLALEKLTRANLRFVVSVSKQYQNKGLSLSDLINEGNLGLIKAAQRFDETRGFKFISYAVWWIRQSILKSIAEQGRIVRLPVNQLGSLNKINKAFTILEQKFEREPTAEELSEISEISIDKIKDCELFSGKPISIDAPFLDEDNSRNLLDVLENSEGITDEKIMYDSLKEEVERSLKTLTPKESDVVKLFYGIDKNRSHTLEEIGAKLGLTRERTRQIKEKAIRKLRNKSRSKILKPYLS